MAGAGLAEYYLCSHCTHAYDVSEQLPLRAMEDENGREGLLPLETYGFIEEDATRALQVKQRREY